MKLGIKNKTNINLKNILWAFSITWALVINLSIKTSSIFVISIFACSYYFINKYYKVGLSTSDKKSNKNNHYIDRINSKSNSRASVTITVLSSIFSVFQTLGNYQELKNRIFVIQFFNYLFSLLGFFILFHLVLIHLYDFLGESTTLINRKKLNFKYKLLIFIGLMALWVPYFINYFPGITPWDTEYQLSQALGNIPLNRAHPIIHTLFFRLIYNIGFSIFRDNNVALSLITIIQMVILSAIFTSLISYVNQKGFYKFIVISIFMFYAFVPVISLYSINLVKDVLFSAIFLLFSLQLWKYEEISSIDRTNQIIYFIQLFAIGTLFCMMRNNAVYVFLALIPFILFYFRKQIVFAIITVILIFGTQRISTNVLFNSYDVKPAYSNDLVEMISIPIQQISRVIKEDGKISSEDYKLLSKVVSLDEVKSQYKPYISDPIKVLIRNSGKKDYLEANKIEYLKLWLRLGINNFNKYIKAYIDQTKGYWYPDLQQAVLMIKSANKQEDLNFTQTHLLGSRVDEFFKDINFIYLDIPLLGSFYSIATYIWLALISITFVFVNRKSILPILPGFILWGTLLLTTPVAHEFRYAYPIIMSVPMYLVVMLESFNRNKDDEYFGNTKKLRE